MTESKPTEQTKEWNLEAYLDLVLRRKYLILTVFILVMAAVLAYSLTRPDIFSSTVTFSTENSPDAGLGGAMPYYYYQMTKPLEYYQAVMSSGLYYDKIVTAALNDSLLLENGGLSAEQIYGLIGRISLSKEEMSELMYMSVTAYDPMVAYRIADIAATAYKDRAREIQEEQARATVEYVSRQVALAEENLENAERELQEFKSKTKFTTTNIDESILQRLSEIENTITEISTQRQLAQANLNVYNERLRQHEDQLGNNFLDNESIEIAQLRRDIEQLQNKKNALVENNGNPNQIRQIQRDIDQRKQNLRDAVLQTPTTEEGTLSQRTTGEEQEIEVYQKRKIDEELNLFTLRNQENYYISLRNSYRRQHPNMLEHSIELAKLQRAKAVTETLYDFLIQAGEEAKIKAATGTGGVKVISPPAIPEMPIPQNVMRQVFIGIILGLGLGIGLALGLDLIDKSIHTPEEIERYLGLSVIGTIPHIDYVTDKVKVKKMAALDEKKNGHSRKEREINERAFQLLPLLGSKNPLVEAYRNLRTDLQFINVDEPLKSLMITSSTPGEGKSLNTANLAISYAELGKSILVVDCDLRKPMQHNIFQMERNPGITDFLARDADLDTIIRPTKIPNLSLISAGTLPPNPAEMLDSLKMNDLISLLADRFELVLYDTPPLIAVSDPKILAPKVGNVMLVVRAGKANFHLIKDAYSRLNKGNTRVIGAVLNGVGTKKGYGYYYRYNYYYNNDYYASEKPKDKERRKKTYSKPKIVRTS